MVQNDVGLSPIPQGMISGTSTSGKLWVLTNLFAITAFALTWVSGLRCNFIKFDFISSERLSVQFGIWYYQYWEVASDGTFTAESCHSYPSDIDIDSSWRASRAFITLAFIFSIFALIMSFTTACGTDDAKESARRFEVHIYLLTAVFQALSLLFLNSKLCSENEILQFAEKEKGLVFEGNCTMSTGANACISAAVIWFGAAASSFMAQKSKKKETSVNADSDLNEPLNL